MQGTMEGEVVMKDYQERRSVKSSASNVEKRWMEVMVGLIQTIERGDQGRGMEGIDGGERYYTKCGTGYKAA